MNQRRKNFIHKNLLTYLPPLLVFLVLSAGNLWMWYQARQISCRLISSQARSAADQIITKLNLLIYERGKDLNHLASIWEDANNNNKEQRFKEDARGILGREPEYREISRVDSAGNILSHISNTSDTLISEISFGKHLKALSTDQFELISSPESKESFLAIFRPILSDSTEKGNFSTAVVGVMRFDSLMKQLARGSIPKEFAAEIIIDGIQIDLTENMDSLTSSSYSIDDRSEVNFTIGNHDARIIIYPPREGLLASLLYQNRIRLILNTIAALFASSLLAFAIYNFLKQKQVMAKLRESEERYQRLTENAKDIIFRLTLPDGRFEFISPSVTEVTGYTQQEFYSRPLFFKQLMDPGWQKNFEIRWKEILIGNTDPFFEYQIISKSGEHKWLHQSNVIITEDGVPVALEGIITDVTAQKKATHEREELIKELEKKNADLERFIYTVSHELRQPLITIKGFLGYLEENAQRGEQSMLHQDIMQIIHATEIMQRLLNDLISLNRVGLAPQKKENVNINEIVRQSTDLFKEKIVQRNIKVTIDPLLPDVHGFRSELMELFQNLIENSIKFTSNKVRPEIHIGFTGSGKEVTFFIRDNGIGFDSRYKDKIFGLFNKLHSDTEGTGVGLALAKRIVEHHGGWIKAESEGPGKGTTIYFTLPTDHS